MLLNLPCVLGDTKECLSCFSTERVESAGHQILGNSAVPVAM